MWSIAVSQSVCLSASISLEPLERSSRNFVCRSPVSWLGPPGSIAIHYVLSVLWMMSCFAVVGRVHSNGLQIVAKYSAWRHCGMGVESDVYECFVKICSFVKVHLQIES